MTVADVSEEPRRRCTAVPPRRARTRRYAMTPPTHFAVEYAINPWMDVSTPVDTERALAQWEGLRRTYLELGHSVEVIAPEPGLPDMVYAANGGLIIGVRAVVARFKYPQRAAEATAYARWMAGLGFSPTTTRHCNEGQGDLLAAGSMILAGTGFRTDVEAHDEIATALGRQVETLTLVDPRFYHLDTALAVLDDTTVAYYPPAFTAASRERLTALFPRVIEVGSADAHAFGLNAVSDGRHVVYPLGARGFGDQLRAAGFVPVAVDLSELLKGGGSVKCCTLEFYS